MWECRVKKCTRSAWQLKTKTAMVYRKISVALSLKQLRTSLNRATKTWMSMPLYLIDTKRVVADLDSFNEELAQAEKRVLWKACPDLLAKPPYCRNFCPQPKAFASWHQPFPVSVWGTVSIMEALGCSMVGALHMSKIVPTTHFFTWFQQNLLKFKLYSRLTESWKTETLMDPN